MPICYNSAEFRRLWHAWNDDLKSLGLSGRFSMRDRQVQEFADTILDSIGTLGDTSSTDDPAELNRIHYRRLPVVEAACLYFLHAKINPGTQKVILDRMIDESGHEKDFEQVQWYAEQLVAGVRKDCGLPE